MSDIPNLEQRLRALATAPDEADWPDVLGRAGEHLPIRRVSRRRVALALSVVVAVAATFAGLFLGWRTWPSAHTEPRGPIGGAGPTGSAGPCLPTDGLGPTGAHGATGAFGPTGQSLAGRNPYGEHGRQITIHELHAEAPYLPLPNSDLANDGNVGTVWVEDPTSDPGGVEAEVYYPRSGIELSEYEDRGRLLGDFGGQTEDSHGIAGVTAINFDCGVGKHPTGRVLYFLIGNRVLALRGTGSLSDLIDVARTLSPSPGDLLPAGALPPADPQHGPWWDDGLLTHAVSRDSVDDATGSLVFQPVVPASLGKPTAIFETDRASAAPSDRALSLRYANSEGSADGDFWLIERPSLSTSTALLREIASDCNGECFAVSMVDLGRGVSGLEVGWPMTDKIVWVENGVYFEVAGYRGWSPSGWVSGVAKAVAKAAG